MKPDGLEDVRLLHRMNPAAMTRGGRAAAGSQASLATRQVSPEPASFIASRLRQALLRLKSLCVGTLPVFGSTKPLPSREGTST